MLGNFNLFNIISKNSFIAFRVENSSLKKRKGILTLSFLFLILFWAGSGMTLLGEGGGHYCPDEF